MGSDYVSAANATTPTNVSIHAPTWGATVYQRLQLGATEVSIHAPTWGATLFSIGGILTIHVSIHAPTWGATVLSGIFFSHISGFNPRSHMGSDAAHYRHAELSLVSIHAPTWGATIVSTPIGRELMFQSTLPHGERPKVLLVFLGQVGFNPRSHMGSDVYGSPRLERVFVSIHAPTWGATLRLNHPIDERLVSIHAPTWGATVPGHNTVVIGVFQSTLPHGERRDNRGSSTPCACFNPRSHMGSDLFRITFGAQCLSFNPRSHMGSDRTFFIFLFYNELQHNFCERAECNNLYIIISTI